MSFDLSDRDYGHILLGDIDLDAQLIAIRGVLSRNRAAEAALSAEIRSLAEESKGARGSYSFRLDDLWVDTMTESVFQDAAHSMAASAMLAPLLEAIFVRLFASVGRQTWPRGADVRAARAGGVAEDFWNPQVYYPKKEPAKTDLPSGLVQLAKETGLSTYLPKDIEAVTRALIAYRNQMFHNGFEWPPEARARFDALVEGSRWPKAWFDRSTSGGETWIVYMTPAFTERCLTLVEEVLEGAGRFARERIEAHGFVDSPKRPAAVGARTT